MNKPEDGKATTVKKTFSRETSVITTIKADPAIIWALLTNATDYPRWNKTVISIDGNIAPGETIRLKSTLDPKRVFKLKVKEFEPDKRLAWGDTMGNRVYTITKSGIDTVEFTMVEKIGGPLFPLFAGMIPSFDESFIQFAACLKAESEIINNPKK
jgi:uncharacterized protein YndB with AHSA1/START domain